MNVSRRIVSFLPALALASLATTASAQTKWDLPAAYPANNFHTENLVQMAGDVDKATGGKQLLQRIADDVRVLDVEDEADVADLLVARPVADVVEHQHVGDRQVGAACGRHAAHRPARERVPGDDQAELELGQLDAARRDEVRRGDDAARRRTLDPGPPGAPIAACGSAGSRCHRGKHQNVENLLTIYRNDF